MEEKTIEKVNQKLFYKKLDNGLEIFMLPNNNIKNVYATFTTKYGSVHDEFVPLGENKMLTVPKGIAHFLEHKMFEQEDGVDPFTFFSKSGTDCNAHTTLKHTTYEFMGPNNFVENIGYLLDFVQELYLTDENVDSEKGIIEQELKMYMDDPIFVLYDGIRNNVFEKSPFKYPIGGTIQSIYKINRAYLTKCYNTFYNPSNMFVVITGNFDPEITLDIITKNQEGKEFKKLDGIKIKEYKEPDKVVKDYEEVSKNVDNNKFAYAIKLNLNKFNNMDEKKRNFYLSLSVESQFDSLSEFYEKMIEKNYLTDPIEFERIITDTHMVIVLLGETNYPKELFAEIDNKFKNIEITMEDFELAKKSMISSYIKRFDNIFALNDYVINEVINFNKYEGNDLDFINSLNYDELKKVSKKIDPSNKSILLVKPHKDNSNEEEK